MASVATAGTAPAGRVTRNFLALATGEAGARLLAFGAGVYLARTLGAASYGVIGFVTAVLLYLNRVADLGLELGGVRIIAEDPARIRTVAPAVLTFRFAAAALLALLTAAVGLMLLPAPDGPVLALYALTLLAVGASTRWIHLGLERATPIGLARAGGEAVMLATVLLLVRGPDDLTVVPLAQFGGDALAALFLVLGLRRHGLPLRPRLDWTTAGPVFRRAWPLVGTTLLALVLFNADLILLRFFRDVTTVGYYAAAYMLVSFLINLGATYRQSLLPAFSRLSNAPDDAAALYRSGLARVVAITLPAAVGATMLAPPIVAMLFGEAYAPAASALRVLIWSVPLLLIRDVPMAVLLARGREDQIFRLTLWTAGLNLALNFILIPRYGMLGAGAATVASEAARMVVAFALVRPYGLRPGGLGPLWRPAAACVPMAAVVLLTQLPVWLQIGAGGGTYLLGLAVLNATFRRRTPEHGGARPPREP